MPYLFSHKRNYKEMDGEIRNWGSILAELSIYFEDRIGR